MDPSTIAMLIAVIGGGIAQFSNSQQANAANQKELDQLKQLYGQLQLPNFDPSNITPQQYQLVQKYVPQVAPHVAELNPTVIQQSQQITSGQDAQRSALAQLQGIASSPTNPELEGMSRQALQQAQASAQSRQQSLLQQYQRQGMLNSGVQQAAQLQAGETAGLQANQATQNAAMQAYQARLQAMQGAAALGGQMTAQDASLQAQNAGIINAFNQRMANSANQYGQYAAGLQNQAQAQNLNAAQQIANANTGQNNAATYQNQARQDKLRQQAYANQLQQYQGMSGLSGAQMGQNTGRAADTNQAIQGVTNAAVMAGSAYGQGQTNQSNQQRADARAFMQANGRAPDAGEFGSPEYYQDQE